MYGKYGINSEFIKACEYMEAVTKNEPGAFEKLAEDGRKAWEGNVSDDKVKVTKTFISSFDGFALEAQIIEPIHAQKDSPCLVYYHGGGWVFSFMLPHIGLMREYVIRTGYKLVCVDYRLAPKYPFPIGTKDCYAALLWTRDNAEQLGINPNKIAVGGDSAGGHFSAAIALMARDEQGPHICGQMLIYPALDARINTESAKAFVDVPVWNTPMTQMVMSQYLANGDCGMRQYASPAEAATHNNLPPAYIEVAEYDSLRDEGLNYAGALKAAGVHAESHLIKGGVHGFDMFPNGRGIVEECLNRRSAFLRKVLED